MAEISVGDALKKVIKSAHWEARINAIKIVEKWESIMGKTIAKYTDKVELHHNKTLFIYTSIAPLKQELQDSKPQIIQRVNSFFKEKVVQSVVIK